MTSRKIAIITATPLELSEQLRDFQRANDQFIIVHTGVGLVNMAIASQKLIFQYQPDACILIGIAGSFTPSLPLNAVVAVKDEVYADLGVWENKHWKDIFDLNLADANRFPFTDKKLRNTYPDESFLRMPAVSGISVNQITTDADTLHLYKNIYGAAIESMEGAAFHQVMLENNTPFLQLRAISNMAGIRDKKQWSIPSAIHAVNQTCIDLLNNGLFN